MSNMETPEAPHCGKVTHHTIQLEWEAALENAGNLELTGDKRIKISVQQEDPDGKWTTIYIGFSKRQTIENLEPSTIYAFRVKFQEDEEESDWSPVTRVTTMKEPLTGVHLHRAVKMNDAIGTERILETGEVNVEVNDKYGFTCLMQAATKGYTDVMELLIRYYADVNAQNDAGKTALMLATYSGRLDSVQVLREHNADYDIRDRGGSTALHWAIDGQNIECLEWCLDDGWDVNVKDSGSHWTPLIRCAAVNGNKDVARVLLKNGAVADAVDSDGKTALMIAVINGHQSLVEVLLSYKADLTLKNTYGKNAVEMAHSMEKRRITKVLEEHMQKHDIQLKKSRMDN